MKEVAAELAKALEGYHVQLSPFVQHHYSLFRQRGDNRMLSGSIGLDLRKRIHDDLSIGLLVRARDGFHETRQHQLCTRLRALSQLLAGYKITLVYSIPHGEDKTAAISLHRAGIFGWWGKRTAFVSKLQALLKSPRTTTATKANKREAK